MESGCSPATMILAELVMGLDDRRESRMHSYRGCIRILQLWLMERLGVLARIERGMSYHAAGVTNRTLSWLRRDRRPIDYFPRFIRERSLVWIMPWWGIREFSVYSDAYGLMLCGLNFGVYIYPSRVLRQMGRAQVIPRVDTQVQNLMDLSDRIIENWVMMWDRRGRLSMLEIPATIRVSHAYVVWTTSRDFRENERLRFEERTAITYKLLVVQGNVVVGPLPIVDVPRRDVLPYDPPRRLSRAPVLLHGPTPPLAPIPTYASILSKRKFGEGTSGSANVPEGAFSRLGNKGRVQSRLSGLKGKKKVIPTKPKPVVRSEMAELIEKAKEKKRRSKDESDEDEDINPKRKY